MAYNPADDPNSPERLSQKEGDPVEYERWKAQRDAIAAQMMQGGGGEGANPDDDPALLGGKLNWRAIRTSSIDGWQSATPCKTPVIFRRACNRAAAPPMSGG